MTEGQRLIYLSTFFYNVYYNSEDHHQDHSVLEQLLPKREQKVKERKKILIK